MTESTKPGDGTTPRAKRSTISSVVRSASLGAARGIREFVAFLLGIVWRRGGRDDVVIYSYSKLIFAWPLLLFGPLFWYPDVWGWIDSETLAWMFNITIAAVVLAVCVDLDRNRTIFWLVLIAAVALLILWLRDAKGVGIFGSVYSVFADLDPTYSRHSALILSCVLLLPYIIIVFGSRINDKWKFTNNVFDHISLGKTDKSLSRAGKTVRAEYPDLLEAALLLAGTIIIADSTGQRVLARIEHVPLLVVRVRSIKHLIESVMVTDGAVVAEDEDAEAAAAAESEDTI